MRKSREFTEVTNDRGCKKHCSVRDNEDSYVITSASAKDLRNAFISKYGKVPTSRWMRNHFTFIKTDNQEV